MIGAIAGDMVGSIYEFDNIRTKDFPLFRPDSQFTDDTVLTVAVAQALMDGGDYASALKRWFGRYPHESYGGRFLQWAVSTERAPYHSFGNGAAMRVSPAGLAGDSLEAVLDTARACTEVTHNHPEGIRGAQATATAIWYARQRASQAEIRDRISDQFGYDLDQTIDEICGGYRFDESCQGTVPQAITAFLEAVDFEDALRNAISIGGDSDTVACIAGGIAEAFFGVPDWIEAEVFARLPEDMTEVTRRFRDRYLRTGSPQ